MDNQHGIYSNASIANSLRSISELPDALTASATNIKDQAEVRGIHQNIEERKKYAEYIFSFTCVWCIGLFFILFGVGLGKLHLSDLIITTLIGSTTVNILVFFTLVTSYLFNSKKST